MMETSSSAGTPPQPALQRPPRGFRYEPALGPRMRVLLIAIFAGVALLGATGIYLLAVRLFEWFSNQVYQTQFSLGMVLAHVLIGVAFFLPFLFFGLRHWITARHRPNRRAVVLGSATFLSGLVIVLSGIALIQLDGLPQLPTGTVGRLVAYWLHILVPVLAVYFYILHRRAGPLIQWRWGYAWGLGVALFTGAMIFMHSHDPRKWNAKGSTEGEKYYEPSKARTVDGNFISARTLMMDEYCLKCHQDIYNSHLHSAHRFSSFNNPAYLFSVRETREKAGVRASRWCAGCHDPVPFFSGEFDDPKYDDVKNPTAHAGITCTVCHAMTHVGSRSGNGDYTIEEPIHYPFAFSDNPTLQWFNNQLVKAKPELHKQTFLKPFHRTEEFCSVCHKVGLPQEVNHYKEFLRGQNHNDSFRLSGVSGHGARSFYYPQEAKNNCAACHMPLLPSDDFGSRDFDGSGVRKVHDHQFPGANTGLHTLTRHEGKEQALAKLVQFLKTGPDGKSPPIRIDLFGLKQVQFDPLRAGPLVVGSAALPAGSLWSAMGLLDMATLRGVSAPLLDDQPLRPNLPTLIQGNTYQAEAVIRTLNLGHHFTQGTVDSNEVWVDLRIWAGDKLLARSGGMDGGEDKGRVDPGAHFINVLLLDRHGNRIDRRNPQDIFTPLYDHQIPPGAAQVAHYRFTVPRNLPPGQGIRLEARVRYRKFDYTYMEKVHGADKVPRLPIVDLCMDQVTLPVAGVIARVPAQTSPIQPAWQRWNDYGIACFLEGGPEGKKDGELGQAERAFRRLLTPEFAEAKNAHPHGWLNLARVHLAYGGTDRLEQARLALEQARQAQPSAPWQTVAWLSGQVNMQNVHFDQAIKDFRTVLDPANRDPARKFDFTQDWVVRNDLGKALFYRAQQEDGPAGQAEFLDQAIREFETTLQLDAENVEAHEFLAKCLLRRGGGDSLKEQQPGVGEPDAKAHNFVKNLIQGGDRSERLAAAIKAGEMLASKGAALPLSSVLEIRFYLDGVVAKSSDLWARVAMLPMLKAIDQRLLEEILPLADQVGNSALLISARTQAAARLEECLTRLDQRPRRIDLVPHLTPLTAWPQTGGPVEVALVTLAEKDVLSGGLPPTRLLKLLHLRPKLKALLDGQSADPELASAARRLLARLHLTLHSIYKPDESAQDQAVARHRSRFPLADRASHPIVIYEVR